MSRFVQVSDFETGKLKISTTIYSSDDLQSIIDEVEIDVLNSLLGCELADLFRANWDSLPLPPTGLNPVYLKLYEAFCEDDKVCKKQVVSKGIKAMMMGFIYFEFVRNQSFTNRTTGQKKTEAENSVSVFPNDYGLFTIYNLGVNSYASIQWLIGENLFDYPVYNGEFKEAMSWI